jgi:hypothetical protein
VIRTKSSVRKPGSDLFETSCAQDARVDETDVDEPAQSHSEAVRKSLDVMLAEPVRPKVRKLLEALIIKSRRRKIKSQASTCRTCWSDRPRDRWKSQLSRNSTSW